VQPASRHLAPLQREGGHQPPLISTVRKRDRLALTIAAALGVSWPIQSLWAVSQGKEPWVSPALGVTVAGIALATAWFLWLKDRSQRQEISTLRLREDRLRLCLWASDSVYWDWNLAEDVIHRAGDQQLYGSDSLGRISGDDWRRIALHPDDLAAVDLRMRRHLSGENSEFVSEHRIRSLDGDYVWVRSRGKIVERTSEGKPLRMAGTAANISATRESEQQLLIAQEALHSISEGVMVMHADGQLRTVNPAFERMSGYAGVELSQLPDRAPLMSAAMSSLAGAEAASENTGATSLNWAALGSMRLDPTLMANLLARTLDLGAWSGELWLRKRTGEDFYVAAELSLIPERPGEAASIVAVLNDLTDRKRAEIEVKHLTNFDPLTGLPNRMMFMSRLTRSLTNSLVSGRQIGLVFLNVDRFTQINESLGHGGGDELLRCLALRVANNIREMDSVARFGGDEFVVMLDTLTSAAEGLEICTRIQRALTEPLQVISTEVAVTASMGLAVAPLHGEHSDQLLRAAVGAMQVVKAMGGDAVHLSSGNDEAAARERIGMETALRRALEREEFSLNYQPVFCLDAKRTIRFEALLRWNNKQFGNVPPDRFIPILEQTGLIAPVGEWVLNAALSQLQRWRWAGFEIGVAVNISPIQLLRGDLQKLIPQLLSRYELAGDLLELELTESVIMADPEHSIATLNEFRALGITIAIDDFGTGYSSLSYLRRLPIQKLKIDKAFIRDLGSDPDDAAIIDTILAMAKVLKLTTVAEGVETKAQLEYLDAQHCDEIQGYFHARPLHADAAAEFLTREAQTWAISGAVSGVKATP
jgi:diguanylate cyclase (GGDEF)-like protein